MKNQFKQFKIKVGNTYTKKDVTPNFFEGEIDVDLDLQLLLPMTPAQMVTLWSQILRDATPFVQAGIIDVSLPKIFEKYVEALGTNINALREDNQAISIEMAETEHNLFADENSSAGMKDVLPNGTQERYLTREHILKHQELLHSDVHLEEPFIGRLAEHIDKDIENFKNMQSRQQQGPAVLPPEALASVGGIVPRAPVIQQPPPATI